MSHHVPKYQTIDVPVMVYPFNDDKSITAQASIILQFEQTLLVTAGRPHDRIIKMHNIQLHLTIDIRDNRYNNINTWPDQLESQNYGPIKISHLGKSTPKHGMTHEIPFDVLEPSKELRAYLQPYAEKIRPTPLIEGETHQIDSVNYQVINGVWNVETINGFEPLRHDSI